MGEARHPETHVRFTPPVSIPRGAQGPPYGVSLSWFLFIHLVIVLLLLSSFNFSYHVGLLLSRLAFVAPVAPLGVSLIPWGAPGPLGQQLVGWLVVSASGLVGWLVVSASGRAPPEGTDSRGYKVANVTAQVGGTNPRNDRGKGCRRWPPENSQSLAIIV